MRIGLVRKIGELIAVLFGYVCEFSLPYIGIEISLPFAGAICTYIVLMETASIVENICIMNPSLRDGLSKIFADEKLIPKDNEKGKHEMEDNKSDL